MKLNNEDKRRLEEVIWMSGMPNWTGKTFDEMVDGRYSVAAARKIRGTYNKINTIANDWDIDRYDVIEYVKGNIYNVSTLLLFLLMNCRNTQTNAVDLSKLIYETTGTTIYSEDLKPMLFGLDSMTQCDPISYNDTFGVDCLTVKK